MLVVIVLSAKEGWLEVHECLFVCLFVYSETTLFLTPKIRLQMDTRVGPGMQIAVDRKNTIFPTQL